MADLATDVSLSIVSGTFIVPVVCVMYASRSSDAKRLNGIHANG